MGGHQLIRTTTVEPGLHLMNYSLSLRRTVSLSLLLVSACFCSPLRAEEKQSLFNGRDLKGWKGDEQIWSVRDGLLVGSSVDHQPKANTFLVWQGGELGDFRLTFQARLEGDNNSGVQYRSKLTNPETWGVSGYQADIHAQTNYTGMLYGEGTGRSIIAERGQKVVIGENKTVTALNGDAPLEPIDVTKWHKYTIEAQGNHLIHKVDGKTTVDVTDNHKKKLDRGILALQVHAGEPMTVWFKDIALEKLAAKKP